MPPPRLARDADVPALAALYAAAAATLGPQVYTPEQVQVWQSFGRDTPEFRRYVLGAETWVAERAGLAVGFCGIDLRRGEVHSLYVDPAHGRRGIGGALLAHALARAEAAGVGRLEVWATPFSRPLFERVGFALHEARRELYRGVEFERYRLHRA